MKKNTWKVVKNLCAVMLVGVMSITITACGGEESTSKLAAQNDGEYVQTNEDAYDTLSALTAEDWASFSDDELNEMTGLLARLTDEERAEIEVVLQEAADLMFGSEVTSFKDYIMSTVTTVYYGDFCDEYTLLLGFSDYDTDNTAIAFQQTKGTSDAPWFLEGPFEFGVQEVVLTYQGTTDYLMFSITGFSDDGQFMEITTPDGSAYTLELKDLEFVENYGNKAGIF